MNVLLFSRFRNGSKCQRNEQLPGNKDEELRDVRGAGSFLSKQGSAGHQEGMSNSSQSGCNLYAEERILAQKDVQTRSLAPEFP
jgi:hypothetical protein